MTAHQSTIAPAALQPIATLREEDGFVLLVSHSGYKATPHQACIGRREAHGLIRDHAGDNPQTETGEAPLYWMPLPWTEEDIAQARAAANSLSNPAMPGFDEVLEGDILDIMHTVRGIVDELAGAIGPRRALVQLQKAIGDDVQGPGLPATAPDELVRVRTLLTQWNFASLRDEAVIASMREILR